MTTSGTVYKSIEFPSGLLQRWMFKQCGVQLNLLVIEDAEAAVQTIRGFLFLASSDESLMWTSVNKTRFQTRIGPVWLNQ